MTLKNKIRKIIEVIKDTDISEIEITSFWGAQKIKLKTNNDNKVENLINRENIGLSETENTLLKEKDIEEISVETSDENNLIQNDDYTMITAPLVGTYYSSAKPGDSPFVEVGKSVTIGDSVCIIEAMKIFNTIESEYNGQIIEVFVDDGEPVEFGQDLFSIKEVDV